MQILTVHGIEIKRYQIIAMTGEGFLSYRSNAVRNGNHGQISTQLKGFFSDSGNAVRNDCGCQSSIVKSAFSDSGNAARNSNRG